MARMREKFETEVPMVLASADAEVTQTVPPPSAVASTNNSLHPLPADEMEHLGMTVVGFVQLIVDGQAIALPVGVMPMRATDQTKDDRGGFFTDRNGRCGILLDAGQAWQNALPVAVDQARRALGADTN